VIKYILLSNSQRVQRAIKYTLDHFERDYNLYFKAVSSLEESDISIGPQQGCDFTLSQKFTSYLKNNDFASPINFSKTNRPIFLNVCGGEDFLFSSFYLLSGMQEWVSDKRDKWGRFPYTGSLQEEYGEAQEAWVDQFFEQIYIKLKSKVNLPAYKRSPSDIVLTHDIDHLSWPILQNSYFYFKNSLRKEGWKSLIKLPKLAENTRRNLSEIMQLEKKYNAHSVFFWLTEKGKGQHGIPNADYSIHDRYVKNIMRRIDESRSTNGLHKSSKKKSLKLEFKAHSNLCPINRYHYLLFDLPSAGKELNETIDQDYSFGFAEQMGFRNAYSRPFHPFDFENWRPFQFLEVPLHIMDTTFHSYLKLSPEEAEEKIISFLSRHQSDSCISILWHNDYLTPFKFNGWGKVYENILKFLFEKHNYRVINPSEVASTYRIYPLGPKR